MSKESAEPAIHRHAAGPAGALVNAYLIEGATEVVAIDSMLTVSDSRALRERLERLGKPLRAVLLTHSHPDHYGGLSELVGSEGAVPIIAVSGVNDVIRRDDEVKDQILRPMFGDEWPTKRFFPNDTVSDGDAVTFDGMTFTVMDIGPSESPHDSAWFLGEDRMTVFLGDQVYDHTHAYLADGFHERWLSNIEQLRSELPPDATLHIGHGGPTSLEALNWQRDYIETFLTAVREADFSRPEEAKAEVIAKVKNYLPSDQLQFLMELSIEPVAAATSRDAG